LIIILAIIVVLSACQANTEATPKGPSESPAQGQAPANDGTPSNNSPQGQNDSKHKLQQMTGRPATIHPKDKTILNLRLMMMRFAFFGRQAHMPVLMLWVMMVRTAVVHVVMRRDARKLCGM